MKTSNDIGYFVREEECKEHSCDYCSNDAFIQVFVDLEEGDRCVELEACVCKTHYDGLVDKLIRERTED